MTLHPAIRIPLARTLTALRRDWDLPGVDAALVALGQQLPDPFDVIAIANATARVLTNRKPIVMTLPGPHRDGTSLATPKTITTCAEHGGTTRRPDGEMACCWTERIEHAAELVQALTPVNTTPDEQPVEATKVDK